jgi:hypothetical protein
MTTEQKLAYEMAISANALAVKNENKKIKEAKNQKAVEVIERSLIKGLDIELIADIAGVSVDFVKSIQQQISTS